MQYRQCWVPASVLHTTCTACVLHITCKTATAAGKLPAVAQLSQPPAYSMRKNTPTNHNHKPHTLEHQHQQERHTPTDLAVTSMCWRGFSFFYANAAVPGTSRWYC
jgi:hypothetical protein